MKDGLNNINLTTNNLNNLLKKQLIKELKYELKDVYNT